MVVKLAAYGLCLILLAMPSAVRSSENLVDKREACRVEARSRIVPKGKIKVDDYRRIVQRRAAYVTQCIGRTMVARSNAPPPPRRVLDDATADAGEPVVASRLPKPRHAAERAKPSRMKAASARAGKAAKPRGAKARSPARRGKWGR
ncbi:hypothetical protein [Microvirga lotononidis]|uniref:Secreted protein n=1 Tax=Microvirga lotononidis TaxID=864069 RepID=I4YNB9_9HYPH|nr:hypothetical protein [Microvirga lotononidis]EIM25461.1 hypothetical protein MicloDRAFT_00061880 [Microvirga lotononidis]WQO26228.1 hypothetical protein U0023_16170 [Microvirga lotononidis]